MGDLTRVAMKMVDGCVSCELAGGPNWFNCEGIEGAQPKDDGARGKVQSEFS